MASTAGPQGVLAAVAVARAALSGVGEPSEVRGSREEWGEVLGELQALLNVATAAQDVALTRLAAIEGEWAEDGTLVEARKVPGHVALDAPALVSGVLAVSAVHAQRRVSEAVRRVVDGPSGTGSATGLGGLHEAMASGVLDGYRAQVVAFELEEVPADVAAAVIDTVAPSFAGEDAPRLRRRVRRVLARVSPELLRQRAVRARSQCRLERWVDAPGVDTWHGTFPSEEACAAWAAVDALAQRYVAEGTCERLDRARATALTDLVTGNASVDVRVTLTTPSDAASGSGSPRDLVEVGGVRAGEPVLLERGWLDHATGAAGVRAAPRRAAVAAGACDPVTGALVDPGSSLGTSAYRPGARLVALVRERDGRCRFPGCAVAARFCDVDHVTAWPAGPTTADNLACLCRRHHRIKQRPGWGVRIGPGGELTWTDPTGRVRTTHPVDHLHLAVLPATESHPPPAPPDRARSVTPDGPHSVLEHTLEHHLGPPGPRLPCRIDHRRPRQHPDQGPVERALVHLKTHPERRRPPPARPKDLPPF